MCGIAAQYSFRGQVDEKPIADALTRMNHRGPDGYRQWADPTRRVALGHTLLGIIGKQRTFQPISDARGCHAVVNGEFYGYEDIRRACAADGHRFHTESDSEILLPLYEKHGLDLFTHLRGEFAFALWDPGEQTLIAARDRFGIKPLYYAEHNHRLYLASEVKALFAMGVPRTWDQEALALYQTAHLPVGRTLFKGVHSVPPAHFLRIQGASHTLHRYWDYPHPQDQPQGDAVERVRELLLSAVQTRLRADVPFGVYLSGGLDSTVVAGLMRHLLPGDITMLTVAFPGTDMDESAIAARSAEHFQTKLLRVDATPARMVDSFESALLASEMPMINSHGAAKYLLSETARDAGLRVVLTGEGSDEVFWGYPHLAEGCPSGVPAWLSDAGSMAKIWHSLYNEELAQSDALARAKDELIDSVERLEGGPSHAIARSAWLWTRTVMPNYLFRNLGDGVEMANSIEGRTPFLDHPLVEYVAALPTDWKIRDGVEKYVLREAARPHIPDEIYKRRKHPFVGPAVGGALRTALLDIVQERATALPFLDAKRLAVVLERLPEAHAGWDPVLFELASLCVLDERLLRSASF